MALGRKVIPLIPKEVSISQLSSAFKLLSKDKIDFIKSRFKLNGRYRSYVDDTGAVCKLDFPVFVYEGRYFATYPGKEKLLGKSSNSHVKLAQDLDSGEWIAVKMIPVYNSDDASDHTEDDVANELDILIKMHDAVLTNSIYREFTLSHSKKEKNLFASPAGSDFFRDQSNGAKLNRHPGKYYLFMKFARGVTLQTIINSEKSWPTYLKLNIAIELIEQVVALHAKGFLHRDINPRNVIVDVLKTNFPMTKLVDFGFAMKQLKKGNPRDEWLGSVGYIAPEVNHENCEKQNVYSESSDIFSLGVTLHKFFNPQNDKADVALFSSLRKTFLDMQTDLPDSRLRLQTVLKILRAESAALSANERKVKVYVLNCCELDKTLHDRVAYQKLIATLRNEYDFVKLYDPANEIALSDVLLKRQLLTEENIVVTDDYFIGDELALLQTLGRHELMSNGLIYEYSYPAPARVNRKNDAALAFAGDAVLDMGFMPDDFNSSQELLSDSEEEYRHIESVSNVVDGVITGSIAMASRGWENCVGFSSSCLSLFNGRTAPNMSQDELQERHISLAEGGWADAEFSSASEEPSSDFNECIEMGVDGPIQVFSPIGWSTLARRGK